MGAIDELLANNRRYAGAVGDLHLDLRPARALAIVTCMDARLNVFAALGLRDGDAHVLRNAGGVVTDDVVRSLALSQRLLGTREVMLIHHTDCGLERLGEEEFRSELEAAAGFAPPFPIGAFADVDDAVRESVLRVRNSPFLLHRDRVRGFVYDVDSHLLREVVVRPASAPDTPPAS